LVSVIVFEIILSLIVALIFFAYLYFCKLLKIKAAIALTLLGFIPSSLLSIFVKDLLKETSFGKLLGGISLGRFCFLVCVLAWFLFYLLFIQVIIQVRKILRKKRRR
jgi:hypothetical protein